MPKITLTFDVPESEVEKLVPSVGVYAVIYTANGIVEVVNDSPCNKGVRASGTNGTLNVVGE